MINGGAVEDYNTLTLWEDAIDDAGNLTDGTVATGAWDAQSGTIADGADVTWNAGADDGTLIHMTDAGASGTFLVKGDDSGDIDNLADDDVIDDGGGNTITVNGAPDSAIVVAECYDDDGDLDDRFTIVGTTQNATNYIIVTTPDGERHDGTDGGFTIDPSANGSVATIDDDYAIIEGVVVKGFTGNYAYGFHISGARGTVRYCISHTFSDSYTRGFNVIGDDYGGWCKLYNNFAYDGTGSAQAGIMASYITGGTTNYIYNNTVQNTRRGFVNGGSSAEYYVLNNNIFQTNSLTDIGSSIASTSSHNIGEYSATGATLAKGAKWSTGTADTNTLNTLTDSGATFITDGVQVGSVVKNTTDTTYGYVTAVTSETVLTLAADTFPDGDEGYEVYKNMFGSTTFVNEGGDDFRLAQSDTLALDKGIDLGAEANTDITGVDRNIGGNVWSIGAHEALLTSAINGGDEAYNTLTLWEDAMDNYGDLTAIKTKVVAECYDDDGTLVDSVAVNGFTTDSAYYPKIYTPTAERHDGTVSQGFKLNAISDWSLTLDIFDPYTRIEGLIICEDTPSSTADGIYLGAASCQITQNIIHGIGGDGIYTHADGDTSYVNDNLIYDNSDRGIQDEWSSSSEYYNNTIVDNGIGISVQSASPIFKNLLCNGNGTDYSGTPHASSTHNLSEDDTVPNINTFYSEKVVVFNDEGNDDFHLGSGDTEAKDKGSDLGTGNDVEIDIDGRDRDAEGDTWDVGADEFVAAAAAAFNQIITNLF